MMHHKGSLSNLIFRFAKGIWSSQNDTNAHWSDDIKCFPYIGMKLLRIKRTRL